MGSFFSFTIFHFFFALKIGTQRFDSLGESAIRLSLQGCVTRVKLSQLWCALNKGSLDRAPLNKSLIFHLWTRLSSVKPIRRGNLHHWTANKSNGQQWPSALRLFFGFIKSVRFYLFVWKLANLVILWIAAGNLIHTARLPRRFSWFWAVSTDSMAACYQKNSTSILISFIWSLFWSWKKCLVNCGRFWIRTSVAPLPPSLAFRPTALN